jgi:hypothetical protein
MALDRDSIWAANGPAFLLFPLAFFLLGHLR